MDARRLRCAAVAGGSARRTVLTARLVLRPATPPTFWIDAILAHDLSILSQ